MAQQPPQRERLVHEHLDLVQPGLVQVARDLQAPGVGLDEQGRAAEAREESVRVERHGLLELGIVARRSEAHVGELHVARPVQGREGALGGLAGDDVRRDGE